MAPREYHPKYHFPKASSPSRPYVLGAAIVLAVLVLLGVGVALWSYQPSAVYISTLMVPKELKNSFFVADGADTEQVYRMQGHTYTEVPHEGALIANDGNGGVAVTRDATGTYRITQKNQSILSTTTAVIGVSQSKNETAVAYAIALDSRTVPFQKNFELPVATIDTQAVRIEYTLRHGSTSVTVFGPTGSAPVYLDDTHISYLSPFGVFVLDTETGKSIELLDHSFTRIPLTVLVSPDHTLLGVRDLKTKTMTIYRVTATEARQVAQIPLPKAAAAYALGNDSLYSVTISSWGTTILKRSLTGKIAYPVLFLPRSLQVNRLLIRTP